MGETQKAPLLQRRSIVFVWLEKEKRKNNNNKEKSREMFHKLSCVWVCMANF